jgi:hypothetical protein
MLDCSIDGGFKRVPKTGVIYVMAKAQENGFYYGNQEWSNLGQGAPETGDIDDAPKRLTNIPLDVQSAEYSPVAGDLNLRKSVAELYNTRYRKDKKSKYTYKNVAICSGGRASLVRIAATIGKINLGHFLPDYTAYEELLNLFSDFVSIPIPYKQSNAFLTSPEEVESVIINMGLSAILLSNPCNPTGQAITGKALSKMVASARRYNCSLIFDEFYSHYIYGLERDSFSACEYINDVNKDNIIVVDGLTKNWRYPGLRISWTLGPEHVIDSIASAGSFLDGGAVNSVQRAVIPLITEAHAKKEAQSIQKLFIKKRDYMYDRLINMGFVMADKPQGSFYCFPSLENLPKPLQNSMNLFEELLKLKVICVPGEFFDVNPGHRRRNIPSRLKKYVRFSFGPSMPELTQGLDRIEDFLKSYQ